MKVDTKPTNVDKDDTQPVEEVDMEESTAADNANEATSNKEDDVEEVPGESHPDLQAFLKSKHKRCILTPNLAREHLRLVRLIYVRFNFTIRPNQGLGINLHLLSFSFVLFFSMMSLVTRKLLISP